MNTEERVLLTSIVFLEKKVKALEDTTTRYSEVLQNAADTYLEYRQTQAMLNQTKEEYALWVLNDMAKHDYPRTPYFLLYQQELLDY